MDIKTIFAALGVAASLWILSMLIKRVYAWIQQINDVLYKFPLDRSNIYDRLTKLEQERYKQ